MKLTIIFILMCIILINPVSALIAGNSDTVMSFADCTSLIIDVEGDLNIESGEYWFENCTETSENKWSCNCYDGYDLIISTLPNTINNYTIAADYTYAVDQPTRRSSRSNWVYPSTTTTIEPNVTKPNVIELNTTTTNITTTSIKVPSDLIIPPPLPIDDPSPKLWLFPTIIFGVIMLGILMWFILF